MDASPLYTGAPLSKEASWLSIYQYAVSNRLTDTATKQLLELMKVHCPPDNSCPTSLYKLKKKLGHISGLINLQYCSNCRQELPKSSKRCQKPECKRKKAQLCYFSILPFENHLGDILSGKWSQILYWVIFTFIILLHLEHWETIHYPFTRQSVPNCIGDIQDGTEYVQLMQPGNFLSVPEHTGLILCSDGAPLFKSSGRLFLVYLK